MITSMLEYICLVQSLRVYLFVPIDFDVVFSSSLNGLFETFWNFKVKQYGDANRGLSFLCLYIL